MIKYLICSTLCTIPLGSVIFNENFDNHYCSPNGVCHTLDLDECVEKSIYWYGQYRLAQIEIKALRGILARDEVYPTQDDLLDVLLEMQIQN